MERYHFPSATLWIVYLLLSIGAVQAADRPRIRTAEIANNPILSSLSPSSGQQGEPITLRGQNFGSRKGKIFFGSTELAENEITSWSDSTVTTTVPERRNQVNVQLMTRREQRSNSLTFTYSSDNTNHGTGFLSNYKIFANNDLGMHCVDDDFSVFSILPPYNTINARVVGLNANGIPQLVGNDAVILRYPPIPDTNNSVNSTSIYIDSTPIRKTNFWDYALPLFGVDLADGQGLKKPLYAGRRTDAR